MNWFTSLVRKTNCSGIAQADADAYFEFAKQDPYLSKHAGEYMVRNAAYLPWNSSLDLRLLQDIKIKAGNSSNKLQLSVDIMNFANLLNSSWGLNQIRVTNTPLQVVGRDNCYWNVESENAKDWRRICEIFVPRSNNRCGYLGHATRHSLHL
jgi:hypothetical protein